MADAGTLSALPTAASDLRARPRVGVFWNTAYGATTYAPSEPIDAPQKNVAVTVVMSYANEPQAGQALDAAAILKQVDS